MARQILSTTNVFLCLLYIIPVLISNTDRVNARSSTTTCSASQYRCIDGECITRFWLCDGDKDCSSGEDETLSLCRTTTTVRSTAKPTCPSTRYKCWNGNCISRSYLCDGDRDCLFGEDESLTQCRTTTRFTQPTCPSTRFKCLYGGCISRSYLCDGDPDCLFGEDETLTQCRTTKRFTTVTCSSTQYRCTEGKCIDSSDLCDGYRDCSTGEDEYLPHCSSSSPVQRYGWYPWAGGGFSLVSLIVCCSCFCWCYRRKGLQRTSRTILTVPSSMQVSAQTVSSQVHNNQNVTNPQPWSASNVPTTMIHPPPYDASCATGITPSALPLHVIHPSVPVSPNYCQGSAYPGPTTTGSLPVEYASQPTENPKQ